MNKTATINETTAKIDHLLLTCIALQDCKKRAHASSCRKTISKITLQRFLSHTSVHTSVRVFSRKCAVYFQNNFS